MDDNINIDPTIDPATTTDRTITATMGSDGEESAADTTLGGGTIDVTTDNADLDGTMRVSPDDDRTTVDQSLPANGQTFDAADGSHPREFVLKSRRYVSSECISDTSGEAQVFLVNDEEGGRYVLKVYYPKFQINKEMLKIILNSHFEMVVKIYDFGKTYVGGKYRDYELMEYLEGGTLSHYDLDGDIDAFRRIALQAAAALAYCHNYNIIHKDIKPSNFFFRDKEKTQLVLGDFGISSIEEGDTQYHYTSQARTPIYAAPEMYSNVIDGKVEITSAVDFFSLGVTLMTVWMGHSPYGANERMMMKMKSEGKIPGINDLPERVRMIVQGLATVNPASRWGYEQVESWFKGESPTVDLSSPFLRYKSFVVDPERNLVADNIHELVPMLLDNERIACGYLYSGKIADWLDRCGNQKLAMLVRETVNKYPKDQQAGLMAVVYAIEPTYPYHDIHGNTVDDIHGVVASLLKYADEYSVLLRNPNNRLWLYVESHSKCNVDRLRGYFGGKIFEKGRQAVMRACYEMDPDLPLFPSRRSSTLKEIVRCFGTEQMTDDEWMSIVDGRLLSWMYCHSDAMACESLRIMTDGKEYSQVLAYKVLYDIDRTAGYDLLEADTPTKVAGYLAEKLIEWQYASDVEFAKLIDEFASPDGRFHYYAQLHGWYDEVEMARRCFDLDAPENRERLGAYNLRTAAYRLCRMMGVDPQYKTHKTHYIANAEELNAIDNSELKMELGKGSLAQWLAAYYHEDPTNDFAEPYSYERKLADWIERLGKIDSSYSYHRRFMQAKKETHDRFARAVHSYKRMMIKSSVWRIAFYSLAALLVVLVAVFGVGNHQMLLANSFYAIAVPVGLMTAVIMGFRAYLKGFETFLSIVWGGIGFATAFIPIHILKYVDKAMPSLFVPAVVAIILIYVAVCFFSEKSKWAKQEKMSLADILADDVKSELIEPLYYTFKTKSYKYKGSKFSIIEEVEDQFIADSTNRIIHYALWSVMALMLVLEVAIYSPGLIDKPLPNFVKQEAKL